MLKSFNIIATASLGGLLATAAVAHSYQAGRLTIHHPWARETAEGQAVGGGFMTIHNDGDTPDRLLSGSTPAAKELQLHSMVMEGTVMRMRQVTDGLAIPAHGELTLKPGSFHVMFIGLKAPLKQGALVPASLRFQHAGTVKVAFKVQPVGSSEPMEAHHAGH